MSHTVKMGIVGTGKVADLHAQAMQNITNCGFCAACNRNQESAARFGRKFGIDVFCSPTEMIEKAGVNAVTIATPHPVHAVTAIEAMRAGAHVLIEKPFASTLEDCDAMLRVSEETGRKIGLISQRRLYPPVQRMRKAIDAGKIGKPVLGIVQMFGWRDEAYYNADPWRGTWKGEGGGVLVNQAPHQLDILQWLMGPIDELYGLWDNLNHPYIEVEDTAVAVIRFKNGGLGNILVSNSQNPALHGKVAVSGENGATIGVQTDGGAMFIAGMSSITEAPYNDIWSVPGEEGLVDQWKKDDEQLFAEIDATVYFHRLQIEDFVRAVVDDSDPMISGKEGRKTVEIIAAIYASRKTGRPVKFA